MSARKIGGGRILGSGKGLAPPDSGLSITSARSPSPVPPSESTLSRGSHNGYGVSPPSTSSPVPDAAQDQDLAANVSLGAPSLNLGGSQLICPICGEEMVTLLQLNRHIDDVHQELPEVQQDEVKTWFDKQVTKAKKFQPLSLINQKLRGLDVFESNETPIVIGAGTSGSGNLRTAELGVDPDELITRRHWQRPTAYDICTDPACARGLGPLNGNINCRKCGKLFCEMHTMYQMKLSRLANHDPVGGYWARVCETCYKSRPSYNDHQGAEGDLTASFLAMRKKRIERQNLEIARLEKRLTKLTQLLANPPAEVLAQLPGGVAGPGGILAGHKNIRKTMEQSVVSWEDDLSVLRCPFCQQEFGSWSFRRHHCRICGRVVCADPHTACSADIGFSVIGRKDFSAEASTSDLATAGEKRRVVTSSINSVTRNRTADGLVNVDIRMCRECQSTIFSKSDFLATVTQNPPDQRAYETLRQFEIGIRQMMPLFQRALQSLQADGQTSTPATHAQIQEAAKIRKRLMDSFTKYNLSAIRLRDLKTDSPTQQRLQKAIFAAASAFLHANMVPLKHVPRMLRAQQFAGDLQAHRRPLAVLNGKGPHLAASRNNDGDTASAAGSDVSSAATALEVEERDVREKLVVLEEQRFLVQQMVESAHGSQRFEEVGALNRNLKELDQEIQRLKGRITKVEKRWESLYAGGTS